MFVPFDQMSPSSRVWVYQSNRPFTEDEKNSILSEAKTFIETWTVHNQTLKASCQLFHGQFLVLAVDESLNAASGCSIDKSVHFVQALGGQYQANLFDRTLQAFLMEGELHLIALKDIKAAVEAGQINAKTPAFNNLVGTIEQLHSQWIQPAGKTWLSRYFKAKEVSA